MGFDLENFGFGVLVGWGSAYAVYRARNLMRGAVTSVSRGASNVQNSTTRSADSRYIIDLVERANTTHLGGLSVKLSDIIVEPRFIPAADFALPLDEAETVHNVFRVIPMVHDHPYLHAPYNIDTLSIDDISTGNRALALLGQPGSGRTSALLTIALHSLGMIKFKPPVDKIQATLDSEEAALSEKERGVRIKERITIEQRAKERLANEQGNAFNAEADEELKKTQPLFRRLVPVYVHFADLLSSPAEYGSEVDPAEPVVRAVQYGVRRVTASTVPRSLYNRFNKGQVLLLVDGFDDLPEFERPRALAWLKAFMSQYSQNFVIVAGPVTGFGAVTQFGFTPVFVRPWSDLDSNTAVTHWADLWPRMDKKRRGGSRPDDGAMERAKTNNRALLPLEITMKAWSSYTGKVEIAGYEGWMRAALARLIPGEQPLAAILPRLSQLAAVQLEEGYITAERLQALSIGSVEGDSAETPSEEPVLDSEANEKTGRKKRGAKAGEEDTETKTAQGRFLASLRKSGLLVRYRGDRYQFRHPLLASYLASLTLKQASADDLSTRLNQQAWKQAVAYTALHTPVDRLVRKRLSVPADVLQNNLIDLGRWLAYAPTDAAWRGDVMRSLGNLLIAPNQYPLIRERAAAALLDSRDTNALLILRRAVRNANADIRRLACLGMGAVGDAEAIRDLQSLIRDQVMDVQLASGMALGAIGTVDALETMLVAFTEGTEQVRQAMAEAFAALPDEGYPILYEAVEDADMMLRRASIFGLRRIRTTWSLIAIYRAFLEDEQWYVRSAAQQAFQEIQYGRAQSPTTAYPQPDAIPWLAEWAANRGETMPSGEGAQQMLLRALQEGEPDIRSLAAVNLGQLGLATMTKSLYNALKDRQENVRSAAHKGLAELQMQIGQPLPNPS